MTYTVQYGDTLGAIAARYHTTVEAIMHANGIVHPDWLRVGQHLDIPTHHAMHHPMHHNMHHAGADSHMEQRLALHEHRLTLHEQRLSELEHRLSQQEQRLTHLEHPHHG